MVSPAPLIPTKNMKHTFFPQQWDEQITDADTGHKLVTVNGEDYELKLCERSKMWLPVECFRQSRNYPDGYLPYCKDYTYKRNRIKEVTPVRIMTPEEDALTKIVSTIEDAVKDVIRENTSLKETIKLLESQKKDLNHLSESEVTQVLRNNNIMPRVLFNMIMEKYPQYQFYSKDTITGMMTPIKKDVV